MKPNYEKAAIKATETLIKYGICSSPVYPLPILKKIPGVLVISYQTMANDLNEDRRCVISMFSEKNQDAFTSVHIKDGKPRYLVTYNQKLPFFILHRALARELGHILLGHDGTRPEEIRNEEAKTFANHLLCPRPLIYSLHEAGVKLTVEVIGQLTGYYDYCISCIRKQKAVHVPAELNRQVRDMFMPFINNFLEFQRYASTHDVSALADLGTYMDGYEE